MAVSEQTAQVKVIRSRLLELGLYSSVVTTATVLAWWFWQRQVVEMALVGGATSDVTTYMPVMTRLLLQKPIVLTFALAEFILGLALLLAITPIGWWLKSDLVERPEISPVTWLARSISGALPDAEDTPPAAEAAVPPAPGSSAEGAAQPQVAGEATQVQNAGIPAPSASSGQPPQPPAQSTQPPAAAQPPTPTQPPAPAQTPAQPVTAQTPAAPGVTTPASQQPQAVQPSETNSALGGTSLRQELEIPAEEESLEALTDVSDILASFADEDLVDPILAQLSASLPEVEIAALTASSQRLAHALHSSLAIAHAASPRGKPRVQRSVAMRAGAPL